MDILILIHGHYGARIAEHLEAHMPADWRLEIVTLPRALPVIVDDPQAHLPSELPAADLVLHLAETQNAAQLLPGVVRLSGARAVIAPIDNDSWIPSGLRLQLMRELAAEGADILFPSPFCALTEALITAEGPRIPERKELLLAFAARFGRPSLRIEENLVDGSIQQVIVARGAPCGSSQYAARRLRGLPLNEAVPQGGLICLHYPCLASMQPTTPKEGVETLMHLSGVIFNEELERALQDGSRKARLPDPK